MKTETQALVHKSHIHLPQRHAVSLDSNGLQWNFDPFKCFKENEVHSVGLIANLW